MDKVEKRRRFIINIIYFVIVLAIVYIVLEYASKWVMPFILGFLVSLAFRPLVKLLSKKANLNQAFCAFVVVILGYSLVGFLVALAGNALFDMLKEFGMNLPSIYIDEISPFLQTANQGFLSFAEKFSPEIADQAGVILNDMLGTLQEKLVELSGRMISGIASVSAKLPLWIISFIFTILSSLFISMDYDHVISFIKRQLPDKTKEMIVDIKNYLGKTIASYLKAYLILMCITFIELSVGFLALRVKNPFGIAGIIAIADMLPVLGTGTVVLPWAVISVFQQRYYLAAGLVILYLIVTAIRHFIEPKVIGDQLGLQPIVALISMYLGFVWFGVFGAIFFVVAMNIVVALQKADKIHIWK